MAADLIAVDWGTTNRRIYLIDGAGLLLRSESDASGIAAVRPGEFAGEVLAIRARFGDGPILIAGMAGSNRGWIEVPYAGCPATLDSLANGIVRAPADGCFIVPGVSCLENGRADVMRGEEVQLLGATAAALVPPDGLLCQPGTHCKWARMDHGAITSFVTSMTGELFSLLQAHSLLSSQMGGPVQAGPAYSAGLAEARRGDLTASLFGVRAAAILGKMPQEDGAAFVSGLLIGADVKVRLRQGGEPVHILAQAALASLYAQAAAAFGGTPHIVDSHAAFIAGITRIWKIFA